MAKYYGLTLCKTEDEFDTKWESLKDEYKDFEELVEWPEKNFWPLREYICAYATDKLRYFGIRVSSAAESAHAELKSLLPNSRGNLFSVATAFKQLVKKKEENFKIELEYAKCRLKQRHKIMCFNQIRGFVSPKCLDLIFNQIRLLRKEDFQESECTGLFTKSYGLPCKHKLLALERSGTPITLDLIHDHWHYKDAPSADQLYLVQDPFPRQSKGRPTGAPNRNKDTSTRRDPSRFELNEHGKKEKRKQKKKAKAQPAPLMSTLSSTLPSSLPSTLPDPTPPTDLSRDPDLDALINDDLDSLFNDPEIGGEDNSKKRRREELPGSAPKRRGRPPGAKDKKPRKKPTKRGDDEGNNSRGGGGGGGGAGVDGQTQQEGS